MPQLYLLRVLSATWLVCFLSFSVSAQPTLLLEDLPMTFSQPTDVLSDGVTEDVLYIVQKGGVINRYDVGEGTVSLVLDISARVVDQSEGGLLGAAFHPAYPDSNYLYVNYTIAGSGGAALTSRISRFTLDNTAVGLDPSERVLLTLDQPADNHNAGDLAFGPDGYLYIPTGDGGGGNDQFRTAQDPLSLLGKLLRIDVDTMVGDLEYAIPADNPFAGSTDTLAEIWALGLRNPWRISFDRETGDLWIGDVGQGAREEVDFVPAGSPGGMNFGWNCREGLIAGPATDPGCGSVDYTDPILDYPHAGNNGINGKSITGGFVYRGPVEELQGYYVFADFVDPRLFIFDTDQLVDGDPQVQVFSNLAAANVSTFGEGTDGSLYLADYSGTIYRLTAEGSTGLGSPVEQIGRVSVFPNPAGGQIGFSVPGTPSGAATVSLSAADGRIVTTWSEVSVEQGRGALNLPAGLARGTYWLNVTVDGHRYVSALSRQ